MSFRRNRIISLLVLAFILFGTFTISNAQTAIFTPDTLYMGKIPVSSKAVRNLIIYNIDVNDLDISSIQINDANFSILNNPGTATLGIAEQIVLIIEFSPSSVGQFDGQISVQSNTNNGATTIQVIGEGLSNTSTYFERIFGPAEGGSLSSFKETPDGGYILVGRTENPDEEVNDVNIVKTDRYGETEWRNVIEDEDHSDEANAVILTDDNHYMVLGETRRDANDDPDFLLMKLDLLGNVVWSKSYGGSKDDNSTSIVECPNGGYLLVGYSDTFTGGSDKDIYIVKVDINGNEQWYKTYGGSGGESASEVINTNDGGFAIIGKTDSKGSGDQDIWLLKINADGDMQWDKTYGGSDRDGGSDIAKFPNGGYAISGYAIGFGPGARDMFLVKTDELGNELWNSAFGESYQDNASNVIIVNDGILITGNMEVRIEPPFEYSDIFLIKTDFDGNELWRKQYGGRLGEGAAEMIINSEDHIVILGSTSSYGNNNRVYFLNLSNQGDFQDYLGISDDKDIIPDDFIIYSNYPNPFNSTTNISYYLNSDSHMIINVYDILGKKIQNLLNSYQVSGLHNIKWDARGLASGSYFLELQTKNNTLVKKMMYLK